MYQGLKIKNNIDSLVAAVCGMIIILLFTKHSGIGICPDGVAYVSTSQNFVSAGSFIDFTHNSLVDFPLLYPFFLSVITWITKLQPLSFAPVVNAGLFGLLIILSGSIMEQSSLSKMLKPVILTCIVLSPCLLEVYSMMWSETIFLLFLLLFIIAIRRYLIMHSLSVLIVAGIIAGLASVTRYAGITIIATGGILLLMDYRINAVKKILHIIVYLCSSTIFLIINLYRNFIQSGTVTGLREKSIHTFWDVANDTGVVFYKWVSFSDTVNVGVGWLTLLIVCFLLVFCVQQLFIKKNLSAYQNIAALFSFVFMLFMLICASLSRFEQMDSRLLSPLFIPFLFCIGSAVTSVYQKTNFKTKKWIIAATAVLFLSVQCSQFKADYETWDGVKDAGIPGYTEDQWRFSRTVNFIKKDSVHFKHGYTIYSNAFDAVNFFTGKNGRFLPHKEFVNDVSKFLDDQRCYMVWFNDGDNPDLVNIDFITHVKRMKLLKQFDDGAIYEYGN